MYNNILLAMHGEEINIESVIEHVLLLAGRTGGGITLLNVGETGLVHYGEVDTLLTFTAKEQFINYIRESARERAEKVFFTFKDAIAKTGVSFTCKSREGNPADEIIKELKEGDYDLLVLGTKQPGPGNTSSRVKERVAKEHPCTVLMVK